MKNKTNKTISKKPFASSNLEEKIDTKFTEIVKLLKLMDQKNLNAQTSIEGKMIMELFHLKRDLQRDLEAQIQLSASEIKTYLDIKLDASELKSDDKAKKYRDQVLTKMDKVMGELQNIREDSIIGTHQIRELRKDVENHTKRITKLEQTAPAA